MEPFAEKAEPEKFTAHITLARFEKLRRDEAGKFAVPSRGNKTFGEWTAKEVNLMESRLAQTGAVHAILEAFKTKSD
jgi:2'-5' RNA ligase